MVRTTRIRAKSSLLLIITVEEVFNRRSAHPRVNMYIFKDIQKIG